jgi:hypothetical protein
MKSAAILRCEETSEATFVVLIFALQEMNASLIESTLLNQLRLVASDHIFPFWVHKTLCIFLKIGKFILPHVRKLFTRAFLLCSAAQNVPF